MSWRFRLFKLVAVGCDLGMVSLAFNGVVGNVVTAVRVQN